MYCIVLHRNRLVARVRRRYFLSAEKRRPKISLRSRATFTSPFPEIFLALGAQTKQDELFPGRASFHHNKDHELSNIFLTE